MCFKYRKGSLAQSFCCPFIYLLWKCCLIFLCKLWNTGYHNDLLGVGFFQKGDRVFTLKTISGGYAEYTVASADTVFPLSDKLDFKQGAALGIPYFTAFHSLFQK